MKRVALFAFYNPNGIVKESVKYLINQIRQVADDIIVVINGEYNQADNFFYEHSTRVILRDNLGFDAGAYKAAILDEQVQKMVMNADELILCNDTFWGPFVPLVNVFEKMKNKDCDFWGLNYSDIGIIKFIQSYFLVIKSRVIREGVLVDFFEKYIDEKSTNMNDALFEFERGIFQCLLENGYNYSTYSTQEYHVFSDYDGSVIIDELPILKRKALTERYYDESKTLNVLKWISDNSDYPIDLIMQECSEFHCELETKVHNHEINLSRAKKIAKAPVEIESIREFISKHEDIYIYGIGDISKNISDNISRNYNDCKKPIFDNVTGYIVSQKAEISTFFGKPVYLLENVKNIEEKNVCMFMNKRDTEDALQNFTAKKVFRIW